jgi:hypothetical protein
MKSELHGKAFSLPALPTNASLREYQSANDAVTNLAAFRIKAC